MGLADVLESGSGSLDPYQCLSSPGEGDVCEEHVGVNRRSGGPSVKDAVVGLEKRGNTSFESFRRIC